MPARNYDLKQKPRLKKYSEKVKKPEQEPKTKFTTERANIIKNNLHLTNQDLQAKTGLSEKIIDLIREFNDNPNLQPREYNKPKAQIEIEESDDRFTVGQIERKVQVTYPVIYKDIRNLDFLAGNKIGEVLYMTTKELERYKDYLKQKYDSE